MRLAMSCIDRAIRGFLDSEKKTKRPRSAFQARVIEPLEPRQLMSLELYWVQLSSVGTIKSNSSISSTNSLDDIHGWVVVDPSASSNRPTWKLAVEELLVGVDPSVTVSGPSGPETVYARRTDNSFNTQNFVALSASELNSSRAGFSSPFNTNNYFDPSSDEEFVYAGNLNYPGTGWGSSTSNDVGYLWQVQTVAFPQYCPTCNSIDSPGPVTMNPGNVDLLGGQAILNGNNVDTTTAMSMDVSGTGMTLGQMIGPVSGTLLAPYPWDYNNSAPTYLAIFGGATCEIFQDPPTVFTSTFPGSQDTLTPVSGGYNLIDASGDQTFFAGTFGASAPAAPMLSTSTKTDAGGNESFVDKGMSGLISDSYSEISLDHVSASKDHYAYDGSGRVTTLTLSSSANFDSSNRTSSSITWTTTQTTINLYYDGTNPDAGPAGSLEMTIVEDGSGNIISETGYRYYSSTAVDTTSSYQSVSDLGLVKMAFSPASMARLNAAAPFLLNSTSSADAQHVLNSTSVSDAQLAPYADNYYTYDGAGRVSIEAIQSTGCSACTGGIGTYTFSYADNTTDWSDGFGYAYTIDPQGYNIWASEVTETTPDGTKTSDFLDGQGLTILQVVTDTNGQQWPTYYRYDAQGHQILTAESSAFVQYQGFDTPIPQFYTLYLPDLVNFDDIWGSQSYLSSNSGLFEWTDYYNCTTNSATAISPGSMYGYQKDTAVSQGFDGTRYYQSFTDYYNYTAGGSTIVTVADSTTFPNNLTSSSDVTLSPSDFQSAGGNTTSYTYTYDGNQLEAMTTELPGISTTHNGPGTSSRDTSVAVYDSFGRTIWTEDGNGNGTFTAYDTATGAIVTSIVDAASSQLPSSLITILSDLSISFHSSGLGLTTTYQPDNLGRTIEETDPSGNVTYTVYDDVDHAVFTIPDVNKIGGTYANGTITTTSPASMVRSDIPYDYASVSWVGTSSTTTTLTGSYTESLTFSGTLTVSNGIVVVPEFISSNTTTSTTILNVLNLNSTVSSGLVIQSLSRSLDNTGTQTVESDAYFNLGGTGANATYLSTAILSPQTGTANTNYYITKYSYDNMGRQARTVDSNGTITDVVFDALGREVATYVGTNDTPNQNFNGYGTDNWEDFLYYVENHNLTVPGATCGTNMTLVTVNQYDFGGIGDGNLTETIEYPGGSQTPRTTEYLYDWRDRQISSKSGVTAAIPSSFTLTNIGSVTLSGTAAFDGSTFSVTGGGLGIDSTNSSSFGDDDGFTLLGQTLSGNTTLITHINGATNISPDSQEGLVLRDGTSGGGLSAAVVYLAGGAVEFLTREFVSSDLSLLGGASDIGSDLWLKLTRSGNTFSAAYSTASTPTSWTTIGTDSIAMSTSLLGGLAVSSAADPALGTGVFDNASIGGTLYTSTLYENDGLHRPLTVNTLDNVGDIVASATYSADKVPMLDSNQDGVPDGLSSATLNSYSSMNYDEQGRVYKSITYNVSPSTGTYSTSAATTLISEAWFDHNGNTIAAWSSGGPMTKTAYDGAGRVAATYTTDGGAVNNTSSPGTILSTWASASTVTYDVVLNQTNYDYDADGDVIETVTADRLPGTANAMGPLFSVSTDTSSSYIGGLVVTAAGGSLAARISYASNYYDAADRLVDSVNVGTNGGSSYERPITSATVSSSTLLLTKYHYNLAGEEDLLTDPKNIVNKTSYDLLGRQTETVMNYNSTVNSGTPSNTYTDVNLTTDYTYDGDNHMLTETAVMPSGHHSQTTQYIYGGFTSGLISNDLLRLVAYPNTSTGAASTASGYAVTYTYDNLGDVLTMTDRNGNTHTYGYDGLGRQVSDSASTKPSPSIIVPTTVWTGPWTFTGNAGITTDPASGDTIGYLESGSSTSASLSQTFNSSSGTYAISFDAALRSGDAQGIDVTVDGTDLGTVTLGYSLDEVHYNNLRFGDLGTISMTGFMPGSLSLSSGLHTLTLTATATSGDNIAYVDNVKLTEEASSLTTTGDPSFEGNASSNGYGIYLVDDPEMGMPVASLPVYLDAGTYELGGFTVVEDMNGQNEGALITLNGQVIGAVQPADTDSEGVASDVFTITEAGDYTLDFSALEYGGSGDEVHINGNFYLFSPSAFGPFSDAATATGTMTLGTIIASQSITTSYNSQGLVDSVTSYDAAAGSGNIVNQVKDVYNGFGQLTHQYQQHAGAVNTSSTLATTYAYNTSNASENGSRLVSLTYPGGSEMDYNYGSTASLNSAISRLDSMSEGTVTLESYQYMGISTVVEEDHPQDGVNLTYLGTANGDAGDHVIGIDRFGSITEQNWFSTNATASVDEYTYTYDLDGNVTSKVNTLHTSFNENYTYDGLSRLTAVSRGTDSTYQSFSLNNIGDINSVTTDGSEQDRSTNDQNQITNIGGNSVSYDSNGNVTTDDHGNTLVYDAWNRLVEVKASDGTIIAGYIYDGYGRMTSETNVTTTTDFYYSGTQDIEERTGVTDYTGASLSSNGTTTLVNVYCPDYVNDILLRDNYVSGTFSSRIYFSHDVNFNVTGVISTTSVVLQREVYDPYGNVNFYDGSWGTSSNSQNLDDMFQGMRYNASIGWYLTGQTNHDRWYSPTMKVWNREDDAGGVNGLNTYGFVADNPIKYTDPTGRDVFNINIQGPYWVNPNTPQSRAQSGLIDVSGNALSDEGSYFLVTETDTKDASWSDWFWHPLESAGEPISMKQYYVPVKTPLTQAETQNFPQFRNENPEIAGELIRYAFSFGVTNKCLKAIKDNANVTYHGLLFSAWAPVLGTIFDANKLNHIFADPGHNLATLVQNAGSEATAAQQIQSATEQVVASQKLTGIFETSVTVGSETITVKGAVINGVVKIGTAFKP